MIGFTAAERVEVDRQYRVLVRSLHELNSAHTRHLRSILAKAESASTDTTLARVLVANEILRGIAWKGRAPLAVRDKIMSAELAGALSEAEKLGRAIGPHAYPPRKGLLGRIFKSKSLSQAGKEALMRCRAIGASHGLRQVGDRRGSAVTAT